MNKIILSTIDNEACSFKEMLKQPDKVDFTQEMINKIDVHERRIHWDLFQRTNFTKCMKKIMSIWAFKRKRLPSGEFLKYKARLCAHGGQK